MQQKISISELEQVKQPIAEAKGLPNLTYTDQELFEFERDHVFAPEWAALAFVDEIEQNNSVKPVDFMGLPLLITRNKAGQIKVFHNVCSHRGLKLVREGRKTNGMMVCPYHSWSYDLDGRLRATPHFGGMGVNSVEGFDCGKHGLKEVRTHIWLGVIFINLDGKADEFAQHVKPLVDRYAPYIGEQGYDEIRLAENHGKLSFDIDCNWKLAVENYTEAYHLPWVHPGLNSYSPLDEHDNVVISADFSGQITHKIKPVFEGLPEFPVFPSWPENLHSHAEYPTFYPNLFLGYQVNHIFALIVHPISPGNIVEDLRIFYVGDNANSDKYELSRQRNLEAWREVFSEDVESVEGMQLGRSSPGYQGGAFSPVHERCSLHFHQWVADKYLTAAKP